MGQAGPYTQYNNRRYVVGWHRRAEALGYAYKARLRGLIQAT